MLAISLLLTWVLTPPPDGPCSLLCGQNNGPDFLARLDSHARRLGTFGVLISPQTSSELSLTFIFIFPLTSRYVHVTQRPRSLSGMSRYFN